MPFSPAHPAAVLPLTRWCPKYLSFPALVIGALTPDIGYLFDIEEFCHSWLGSLEFCLPMGLVLIGLFYAVRMPLVTLLPPTHRQALQPFCAQRHGAWGNLIFSLLIGTWTHLLWDSFTHEDGWLVLHFSLLRQPLASMGGHELQLCRGLWILSSALGMILLTVKYSLWLKEVKGSASLGAAKEWRYYLSWATILLIVAAIAAAFNVQRFKGKTGVYEFYNFIHDSLAAFLVMTGLLLIVIGLILRALRK
jgi:Domain of unknown function (DUF4184)